jgi:hypothetical protein
MKSEISQLNRLVEVEKTNLSQKVTAELDSTLKKAVREKIQIQQEMELVVEANKQLQNKLDLMQENYNKQVRLNLEL